MARDLAIPTEVIACPTVREADGLALSSRNRYLSPAERQQALALPLALTRADELIARGQRASAAILAEIPGVLTSAGIERIDHVPLPDPATLAEKPTIDGPTVTLIAAHVGTTRLIDNRLLCPPHLRPPTSDH